MEHSSHQPVQPRCDRVHAACHGGLYKAVHEKSRQTPDEGKRERGGRAVKAEGEPRTRSRFDIDLERPRGADPVRGEPQRETARVVRTHGAGRIRNRLPIQNEPLRSVVGATKTRRDKRSVGRSSGVESFAQTHEPWAILSLQERDCLRSRHRLRPPGSLGRSLAAPERNPRIGDQRGFGLYCAH